MKRFIQSIAAAAAFCIMAVATAQDQRREAQQAAPAVSPSESASPAPEMTVSTEPGKTVVFKTVAGPDGKQQELKIYFWMPKDWQASDKRPALVLWHGGGFTRGTPRGLFAQAEYLAGRGMVAGSADYRLGAGVPTAAEDARSAMRWVKKHAAELGIDPSKIVAGGGSAGGYLATAVATGVGPNAAGDDLSIDPAPAAVVGFNPALRTDPSPPPPARDGRPRGPMDLSGPIASIKKGVPPSIMFYGTRDALMEGGKAFCEKSIELGTRSEIWTAEGEGHAFFNRPPWKQLTARKADEFLVSLGLLQGKPTLEIPQGKQRLERMPAPLLWVDNRVQPLPPRVAHKTFHSKAMNREVGYLIYLPPGYEKGDQRYPVLYWLHGLGGTEYRFPELAARIDKAIAEKKIPPMIVAFPNGGAWAFYSDSPDRKIIAETLIIDDFIPHLDAAYRTIASRNGRLLQGYSMGGHGALKLALKHPELFGSVAAGAPAMLDVAALKDGRGYIFETMFGADEALYNSNRPVEIAREKADQIRGKLPMMIFVGSEDRLLRYSEEFRDLAAEKRLPLEFVLCEGKAHDKTGCYDLAFERIMAFQIRHLAEE